MAKYKNEKTGAMIETDCKISGGNWVEVSTKKTTKKGKKDDAENVSSQDDDSAAENVKEDENE